MAKLLPKASKKCFQLMCDGPPGAHRPLFDLEEIGGIPSKGAYPPWSKVAKLPFNGAAFTPVAFVRSELCVTETHGAERAGYMQNQVLIPALVARLDVGVSDKQKALAVHEAKATDAASDATERQCANDAIVAQTPYLSALEKVQLKMGECFQVLLVEPLAKHIHNALDYSTLDYAVRDYADKESMKLRGQVCNGFRAEPSLIYIARRTAGISGADARATSFLGSNLLSMPLPDMFHKLPPIFVLSKPKLVAATTDADSIAAQFSACELAKTKLHLLAGEPIVNTDGENHHHGYDQLAKENITTESTDVYSIAHPFGADEAAEHAWMRAFYKAPKGSGLTVAVEFTAETFFIRELDVLSVGEAVTGAVVMRDNCLSRQGGWQQNHAIVMALAKDVMSAEYFCVWFSLPPAPNTGRRQPQTGATPPFLYFCLFLESERFVIGTVDTLRIPGLLPRHLPSELLQSRDRTRAKHILTMAFELRAVAGIARPTDRATFGRLTVARR